MLKRTPSFWMFSAALAASDGRHPKREGDFEGGKDGQSIVGWLTVSLVLGAGLEGAVAALHGE